MKNKKILPSILSADFSNLSNDISKVIDAGIDSLHIDVMDGHFVPNISIGPPVLKSLKTKFPDIFFDVHLMITNPEKYIKSFVDAGADLLNIHLEIGDYDSIISNLNLIKSYGLYCGLTCNPGTPIEKIKPFLDKIDLVLVMTVQPGFGGQSFIYQAAEKIIYLSKNKSDNNYNYIIQIDGGINKNTFDTAKYLGAEWFVIGSAIFEKNDIKKEAEFYMRSL